ncbi:hypothetical protein BKM78_10190 [Tessaracoccus sp. T2.5-30]|nr:hypothetical protein BKM78_10190 [Tessaracoccus sp. T2.5-30]VEP40828.1 hypothetical protein TLA_TLA_02055 [Tessaracoccus lapidicaptus]
MIRPPVRWWALGVAAAPALAVGWLVFVADGWTVNRLVIAVWTHLGTLGIDLTPAQVDGALNTVMLAPISFLAALWLPAVRWWVWGLAGAAASVAIEGVQYFTARDANGYDVATNSLGALVGAAVGGIVNAALARRSRLVERSVGVLGQEPGGDHRDREHGPEQPEQHRATGGGDHPRHD